MHQYSYTDFSEVSIIRSQPVTLTSRRLFIKPILINILHISLLDVSVERWMEAQIYDGELQKD